MRLLNLTISNLFSYGEMESLDLSKVSLALIMGQVETNVNKSNGSGKSTIFEAISWILFGETKRFQGADGIVRLKQSVGFGVLTFENEGKVYEVTRTRHILRSKTVLVFKQLEPLVVNLTGATLSDTQKSIISVIKINYPIFKNSVFFSQGDLSGFLYGTDKDRKDLVGQLMNLETFDAALKETRDQLQRINMKLAGVDGKLIALSGFQVDTGIGDRILLLRQGISEKESLLSQAKDQLALKQGELDRIRSDVARSEALEREIEALSGVVRSYEDEVNQIDNKLLVQEPDLLTSKEEVEYLLEQINHLSVILSELIKKKALFQQSDSKCYVCGNPMDEKHKLQVEQEFQTKVDEIRLTLHSSKTSLELNQQLGIINSKLRLISTYKSLAEKLEKGKDRYEATIKKIDELGQEKDSLSVEGYLYLSEETKTFSWRVNRYEEELTDLRVELRGAVNQQQQASKLTSDITALTAEKSSVENEKMALLVLEEAFGQKGIKSFVIDNVVPVLEGKINYYLRILTGASIYVELETHGEDKSGKDVDKFEIYVKDQTGSREYRSYSGGESKIVEIAIRLALSEMAIERAGTKIDFLLLDEVTEDLDPVAQESVFNLLSELRKKFSTILVVSHLPLVQNLFDTTINVIKKGGISRFVGA